MTDSNEEEWLAERNEAFLSLDEAKIKAYMQKHGVKILLGDYFWISVHAARTALQSLPMLERFISAYWLRMRNLPVLPTDDKIQLPQEEMPALIKRCKELGIELPPEWGRKH